MAGAVASRLAARGLSLPPAHRPVATYLGCSVSGNEVWISGQGPTWGQEIRYSGKVGTDLSIEQGRAAAELTCLNLLAQLALACGDLDRVVGCSRIFALINSAAGFQDHEQVLDGASDLLIAVFGERGRHARSAVSAPGLPFSIAVEMDAMFTIE